MNKYKIGYTTGVFDLFHIGHLNILRKSKEKCEYLIVGVSTDENVFSYKRKYPVIPFEERMEIVKSIKYVDEVVPQTTMDKYHAWEKIKFDVIFHGNDWKGSNMYNIIEDKFQKVGVNMVYFEYTKGISSTKIADSISAK